MGLIIGLDLCDSYTQLSCYEKEKNWTFPTIICKTKGENEWLVGEEAYGRNLAGDGILVDKLLNLVSRDGTATIENIRYEAVRLLELYLEQVLKLPRQEFGEAEIDQMAVTLPSLSGKVMDAFLYCADYLGIPRERVHIISHEESFIYYVLSQKKEIWSNQVGLFDLSADRFRYYEMKVQRGMQKAMVVAESENQEETFNLDVLDTASGAKLADKIVSSCASRLLEKKLFSTIILTGKGFERQDWAPDFMKVICPRRRVFVETALFSKGAALRAYDYMQEKTSYPYVCICEGRLRSTVSMQILYKERPSQLVVAAAGENWYESKTTMEFLTDEAKAVELTVTPMDPKRKTTVTIPLEGFPKRPAWTTRLRMSVGFLNESTMAVAIKDRGFGELFPATDALVRREVRL